MDTRDKHTGPVTNTYQRPWSVVDNEELATLRKIKELAKGLAHGCNCDYDYRCGACQRIIDIWELAQEK